MSDETKTPPTTTVEATTAQRNMTKAEKILKWVRAIRQYAMSPEMVELRRENVGLFRGTVMERYMPFVEKYQFIFHRLLDDPAGFEMDRLEAMLNKMYRIETGQADYETENLRVGKAYYEEFLKPQLAAQGKKIDVYNDVKLEDTD